jgi:2-C-methyl-D-erythritol 2,4-cyclodiphosphate synthase
MKPHLPAMREKISAVMGVDPETIGIKATTNEKQDSVGMENAIAVHAVVLLEKV